MPGRGCSDIKLSSGWDVAGGDSAAHLTSTRHPWPQTQHISRQAIGSKQASIELISFYCN